jgi:hypothetical protein
MNKAKKLIQFVEEEGLRDPAIDAIKDRNIRNEGDVGHQELKDVFKQTGLIGKIKWVDPKTGNIHAKFLGKNRPGSIDYEPENGRFYFNAPYYWGKGWSHYAPDFMTNGEPGGNKEDLIKFLLDLKSGRLSEKVVKKGGEYCVIAHKSGKNMGCYPSKKRANKRLGQIHYFKNQ